MKILVIDDNSDHRAAAEAQLKDHNLTVVGTYDEGVELVNPMMGDSKCEFDVVLTDLLMPASKESQGDKGEQFIGQEMPVGIFLALMAAANGAKYVAVSTDANHHDHPASACLDYYHYSRKDFLRVEDAKLVFSNTSVEYFSRKDLSKKVDREDKDAVWVKDWRALLDWLLEN